ncbi:hypothetical protein GCM10022267_36690 [Lentzea roselyniae]|uniref:Uncharacterized protein n=1 Tax=Lentzea roselyniae TaxID=531940 RepID=A0ABP7B3A9_9PSEU
MWWVGFGGTGILHSNIDSGRDHKTGELTVRNEHWRAPTMFAEKALAEESREITEVHRTS